MSDPTRVFDIYRMPQPEVTELFGSDAVEAWNTAVAWHNQRTHSGEPQKLRRVYEGGVEWNPTT